MPDAIIASNLAFSVRNATLIEDVDFRAAWRELVAIIGPNGAGKSTLLGVLSGDLTPRSGTVHLDGFDVANAPLTELATMRAVLSQRTPIEIPFTAAEVVAMGRYPYRHDESNTDERDSELVRSSLDRTDTARFANRIYRTLSGGERSRVSLARVLAQDTPIVMLDEPTTALDVAQQQRVMNVVSQLAHEGRSVVTVMHDLNAAAVHADRIVLMSGGHVVADGTPGDVLRADVLSDIYGHRMLVTKHPIHDCPLVLPR